MKPRRHLSQVVSVENVKNFQRNFTEISFKNDFSVFFNVLLISCYLKGFFTVVKVTLLLADMADFATVNKIYGESNSKDYDDERLKYANLPFSAFKPPFPARAAYQVAALPRNCRIEIEAIAHLGDINDS